MRMCENVTARDNIIIFEIVGSLQYAGGINVFGDVEWSEVKSLWYYSTMYSKSIK